MTQRALADHCGVSREHLNAVIRGRIRPGGKLAVKLEAATGISLATWLTGTTEERRAAWAGRRDKSPMEAEHES